MKGQVRMAFRGILLVLILAATSIVYAQDDVCGIYMGSPYAVALEACSDLEPNQVCYGNPLVEAELDDPDLTFAAPGDAVDISAVESLNLSPETLSAASGGIVHMRLTDEEAETDIYVALYGVVTLTPDEDGGYVIETGEPPEGCTPFPSGVLVYSADDVSIVINGVTLEIGAGVVHLATNEAGELVITVLEGVADVTAGEETVTLGVDEFTTVPLDSDGIADGVPAESATGDIEALDVPEEILESFAALAESETRD